MSPSERLKLTDKELRQVVRTLADAGNKRLKRLEQAGLGNSPAASFISREGGKFSTKGKSTRGALQKELQRELNFFSAKTSNVKSAREYQVQTENFLASVARTATGDYDPKTGKPVFATQPLTPEQQKAFWTVWSHYKYSPTYQYYYQKEQVQSYITQYVIENASRINAAAEFYKDSDTPYYRQGWVTFDEMLRDVEKRVYEEGEMDLSDLDEWEDENPFEE